MKVKVNVLRIAIWLVVLAVLAAMFSLVRGSATPADAASSIEMKIPSGYFTALFGVSSTELDETQFARTYGLEACTVEADGITLKMSEADHQALTALLDEQALESAQNVASLPEIGDVSYASERITLTLAPGITQVPETIAAPLALIASAQQYWHGEPEPAVTFTLQQADGTPFDTFTLYGEALLSDNA